jgi:hypothetical protein
MKRERFRDLEREREREREREFGDEREERSELIIFFPYRRSSFFVIPCIPLFGPVALPLFLSILARKHREYRSHCSLRRRQRLVRNETLHNKNPSD